MKKETGIFFLLSEQEKTITISSREILEKHIKKVETNNKLIITKKNKEFKEKNINQINYTHLSQNEITSIGTQLIPFLEHNDANRTLMGTNMQRQAVSLKDKEIPIVQTGIEKEICKISNFNKISDTSGIAYFINKKNLIIHDIIKKNLMKRKKNLFIKKLISKNFQEDNNNIIKYKEKKYAFEELQKTTQNTFKKQKEIISEKNWIKKGETLTDNSSTLNGKLAIGKNLLIGYMCWKGYNFEDAIVINESLINQNKLTSTHIKKYKTFLITNEIGEVRIFKLI